MRQVYRVQALACVVGKKSFEGLGRNAATRHLLSVAGSRLYRQLSAGAPRHEFIQGTYVTPNLFPILKVEPALGRMFVSEEDQFGKHRVVLLSHGLWQRRFSGDRNVVGRPISVAGEQYTIVGVMPAGMPFFDNLPETDPLVALRAE